MAGKKDISNKQRMAIELTAILLVGGAVLWTKSAPGQQVEPSGPATQDVIRAHRLEIVGKDGGVYAALGMKPASEVTPTGAPTGVQDPYLGMYDGKTERIDLTVARSSNGLIGSPMLFMNDKAGFTRALISVDSNEEAMFRVWQPVPKETPASLSGTTIVPLAAEILSSKDQSPRMMVLGKDGKLHQVKTER